MPRQKAHTESDKSTHLLTSFHYSRRQLAAACILQPCVIMFQIKIEEVGCTMFSCRNYLDGVPTFLLILSFNFRTFDLKYVKNLQILPHCSQRRRKVLFWPLFVRHSGLSSSKLQVHNTSFIHIRHKACYRNDETAHDWCSP